MTYSDFQSEISTEADRLQPQVILALWEKLEKFGNGDAITRYTSLLFTYVGLKKTIHKLKKRVECDYPWSFHIDAPHPMGDELDYKGRSYDRSTINRLEESLDRVQLEKYWLRVELTSMGVDYKKFHKWIPS